MGAGILRRARGASQLPASPPRPYIPRTLEVTVALSGTLSTFPLSDLLQWLGTAGKTGTLRVRGDRYTKTVYLKEGRIVSSASDDPTQQLGQFLLSHGRISEEDLRKGLETQSS